MTDVVIAASEADARAAEAVVQHHAQLSAALAARAEALLRAVAESDAQAADQAVQQLAGWCAAELLPHAVAEEEALYPAARATVEGRLLVEGMLSEHEAITGLVRELRTATDPVHAAGSATALRVLFDAHLAKENDLVLPLLSRTPGVSVAELLGDLHELLGAEDHRATQEPGEPGSGHTCSCGEADQAGFPELDARSIPHAIRHATIFGALDATRPGGGVVLVASHDPLPLLAQLEERAPGAFEVEYLERGPETWRLSIARRLG